MKLSKLLILIILIVFSPKVEIYAQNSFGSSHTNLTPLIENKSSGIYEVRDNGFTIVAIDLRLISIVQSYGAIAESTKTSSGKFLLNIPSPSFKRVPYKSIIDTLDSNFLAFINASFFENYNTYTPLSFPIFDNHRYITSGSSPYAYVDSKHPYYSTINLYSLNIFDEYATVEVFDSTNQISDKTTSIVHQFVSYRYKDHPALVLGNNRETRFLLTGLVDQNNDDMSEYLLIAIGRGTIGNVADVLKNLGVTSEIISFDGGSSVLLYNKLLGYLEEPHTYDDQGNYIQIQSLPHYLYFVFK